MSDKLSLNSAITLLKKGDVVAMPTETVYGLAGSVESHAGLLKIFSTKERPFFDPLIVHIANIEFAKKLSADWTPVHEVLGQAFWPGPLTLTTKRLTTLDDVITAGLEQVAIRCPNHPVALELLQHFPLGLAAPSANRFGKTSPTTSQHVIREFQGQVPVLEGGDCQVGIESTVAGVSSTGQQNWKVEIYRPGTLTAEHLKTALNKAGLSQVEVSYAQSPVAPGQLKHHYMPNVPLYIARENTTNAVLTTIPADQRAYVQSWQLPADAQISARLLYAKMRELAEAPSCSALLFILPDIAFVRSEDWAGILNRLAKAASGGQF